MKEINELRKEIDDIDSELIELFCRRMERAKQIGLLKKQSGTPVLDRAREKVVLEKAYLNGKEYGDFARRLFSDIMELSRELQYKDANYDSELRCAVAQAGDIPENVDLAVACQGIKGANSFEAARSLFPDADLRGYKTFEGVFEAVNSGQVGFGVLPVENSTAGSVSAVYDLILKYRFYIVGAADKQIEHCLAGLKQSTLEDIETVWSHPQALSQCERYISGYNFSAVPKSNTAVAAREVAAEKRLNVAAICSPAAAKEYGLKILERSLQDNLFNTTRFIVISKKLYIPDDANKISLCFSLPHVKGSLYTLLCRFNSLGLNLTKIESRPSKGREFEYLFYLDFTGNIHNESVLNLISQLSMDLPEFSFLGNYKE